MKTSRRQFVSKSIAGMAMMSLPRLSFARSLRDMPGTDRSNPWIELSKAAYLRNAQQISRMAEGKPVVAVLKNNAYGLGATEVSKALDPSPHIFGMAVVKDETALNMRAAGVTKPILLMGDFDKDRMAELIRTDITLSIYSQSSLEKIAEAAKSSERPLSVALYIDTGLGRMGLPYEQAVRVAKAINENPTLNLAQTFSTLTTPKDFATEQISRFQDIIRQLDRQEIPTGLKHLAPSYSLLDLPNSHADAVRPGILLHGSFPLAHMEEAERYPLQVPYRLKAPVIRLEKLKAGDTIGFSRFYEVKEDEWIATLPIGWADGYNSGAENGAKVLLDDQLFPVVNVNASHANIALGPDTNVKVGSIATLIGPERPEITPEGFGKLVDGHNYLQINYKESIPKHVYETF